VLPDPQRALGPRHARIAAVAGSGNCGQHLAGLGIDLLDALFEDLEDVAAIECPARHRGGIDLADDQAAHRVQPRQPVAPGGPALVAVERQPMHLIGAWKGSVFAEDLGGFLDHVSFLLFPPKRSLGRCRRLTSTEGSRASVAVLMTPPSASRTPPHARR